MPAETLSVDDWHDFALGPETGDVNAVFTGVAFQHPSLDVGGLWWWGKVRTLSTWSYTGVFRIVDHRYSSKELVSCPVFNSPEPRVWRYRFSVDPCGRYVAYRGWYYGDEYLWLIAR
jgi:hypothetical protein